MKLFARLFRDPRVDALLERVETLETDVRELQANNTMYIGSKDRGLPFWMRPAGAKVGDVCRLILNHLDLMIVRPEASTPPLTLTKKPKTK